MSPGLTAAPVLVVKSCNTSGNVCLLCEALSVGTTWEERISDKSASWRFSTFVFLHCRTEQNLQNST